MSKEIGSLSLTLRRSSGSRRSKEIHAFDMRASLSANYFRRFRDDSMTDALTFAIVIATRLDEINADNARDI